MANPGRLSFCRVTEVCGHGLELRTHIPCEPGSVHLYWKGGKFSQSISARERDVVGNTAPENMAAAERRLEVLSDATIREAESWDWSECANQGGNFCP